VAVAINGAYHVINSNTQAGRLLLIDNHLLQIVSHTLHVHTLTVNIYQQKGGRHLRCHEASMLFNVAGCEDEEK
jgi:hypothetical protein